MSPWVRIDENAMDHPKFLALSDGAWRLWCEGQAYCQKHLTDGLILAAALRGFRYYSPARVKSLTAVLVSGKGSLWHQEAGGYRVHDFTDWNESRADVLKERAQAKERRERWKEHRRNASPDASLDAEKTASVVRGVVCSSNSEPCKEREGGVGETAMTKRAGAFCEWYAETHERIIGVGYLGNPQKDYQKALELCEVFSDQELRDAALVWFGMADDFATNGTRTISKFASRASACVQTAKRVTA